MTVSSNIHVVRQEHVKDVHFVNSHTFNLTGDEGFDFGTSCSLSLRL